MVNSSPIFIMSSERSGSNLLRTLLSNHSRIAAPTAVQFLQLFHRVVPFYGDVQRPEAARALFEDMLSIANHEYFGWALDYTFDEAKEYPARCFLDIFDVLYREKMRRERKSRFLCKENNVFDFAGILSRYYGEIRFIYLYRDPRDCAASWMKVPLGPATPLGAARRWAEEQVRCLALVHAFGIEALPISYEDLISDTEREMRRVLEFLSEDVEPECFQVDTSKGKELEWNTFRTNLCRPVMTGNTKKYRKEFKEETICMVETICREPMIRLGYRPETAANWRSTPGFRLREAWRGRRRRREQIRGSERTIASFRSRHALYRSIIDRRRQEWLDGTAARRDPSKESRP